MKIGDRINNSISNFTNPKNLLSKVKSPLKTQGGSNKKKYNNKFKKHTSKNKYK